MDLAHITRPQGRSVDARLPNLLIAGVAKSGTSSLYWYLAQHPDICASAVKEPDYFRPARDGHRLAHLATYHSLFRHCGDQAYRLEASSSYGPGGRPVIAAVKRTLGRPRIIISLRDPVRRLWSAYAWRKAGGRLTEIRNCDDYISACEQRQQQARDGRLESDYVALSVGKYIDYVLGWLDEFKGDIKLVFAESLFRDPVGVTRDVCAWLGIDEAVTAGFDYGARGRTIQPRSRLMATAKHRLRRANEPVLRRLPRTRARLRGMYRRLNATEVGDVLPEPTRRRLEEIYREPNAALAEALRARGYVDLPEWLC